MEDFPLFGPTVLDDQFHGFLWNFLINTLLNGNSPQNLIYPPVKYIHKIVKVSAREIANIKFLVHSKYVFAFLQYLICFGNQETTSLLAQIHLFLQPLGPNKLTVSPSLPEPINFHLQCFHVNFSRCICPLLFMIWNKKRFSISEIMWQEFYQIPIITLSALHQIKFS